VIETRSAPDHWWHFARDERGVYMRLAPDSKALTFSTEEAQKIYEALGELLDAR
jgi:hypothetical protein